MGQVEEVGLCSEDWDGPGVQLAGQHTAFRIVASDRTVDVSILIGVCRLRDEGLVRISAQAIRETQMHEVALTVAATDAESGIDRIVGLAPYGILDRGTGDRSYSGCVAAPAS